MRNVVVIDSKVRAVTACSCWGLCMLRLDERNACLVQSTCSPIHLVSQEVKTSNQTDLVFKDSMEHLQYAQRKLAVRLCPTTQHRPEAAPPPMPSVLILLPDSLHLFPIINCHRSNTSDIFGSSAGCSGISRVGTSFHRCLSKKIRVRAVE
jgi:hypothetical protein